LKTVAGPGAKSPAQADPQTGLEMGLQAVAGHGAAGRAAVGQEHLVVRDVHGGRVGHERGLAGQGVEQQHGERRRHVAFAAADQPFVVEPRQGQAAAGTQRGDQVEAAQRRRPQPVLEENGFQGEEQARRVQDGFFIHAVQRRRPGRETARQRRRPGFVGLVRLQYVVQGNIQQVGSPAFF